MKVNPCDLGKVFVMASIIHIDFKRATSKYFKTEGQEQTISKGGRLWKLFSIQS